MDKVKYRSWCFHLFKLIIETEYYKLGNTLMTQCSHSAIIVKEEIVYCVLLQGSQSALYLFRVPPGSGVNRKNVWEGQILDYAIFERKILGGTSLGVVDKMKLSPSVSTLDFIQISMCFKTKAHFRNTKFENLGWTMAPFSLWLSTPMHPGVHLWGAGNYILT